MTSAADVLAGTATYALHHGDGVAWLDSLPSESVDAVVCDPPYAEIDRDYGRMTEPEWEAFAHALVRSTLRVLKPRGSAVFIVQPNSERVGRMRVWVFRFLAWCADDLVRETGGAHRHGAGCVVVEYRGTADGPLPPRAGAYAPIGQSVRVDRPRRLLPRPGVRALDGE